MHAGATSRRRLSTASARASGWPITSIAISRAELDPAHYAALQAAFEQIVLDTLADEALEFVSRTPAPFGPNERKTGHCNRCDGSGFYNDRGGICYRCAGSGLPPADRGRPDHRSRAGARRSAGTKTDMNIPALRIILAQLSTEPPIAWTPARDRAAGRLFRRIWLDHEIERGYRSGPAPQHTPRCLSGGCIFGATVAHALFGGEIRTNWQHVWLKRGETIVDFTGLADVPLERAIQDHIRMLRNRGFAVTRNGDGTYRVQNPAAAITIGSPRCDETLVDPKTFFVHDPTRLRSTEFRLILSSVVPRALRWHTQIRTDLTRSGAI